MIIYFRGCIVREKLKYISDATETILKSAGLDFIVLNNEKCCGSFLMKTGFKEDARQVMSETLNNLLGSLSKDDKILVSCAGCYNTLKNDYSEIFGVELDVIHSSELIWQLINEEKINIKKTPVKVTYHDPCHLGRHSGLFDEPRRVIKETCTLVEMDRNRENSRCCGAGGGVKSGYPDTALLVASRRIDDAENTEAELLVTSCSFCILNLKNALELRNNKEMTDSLNEGNSCVNKIIDISELILMGLEYEEV